MAALVTVVVGVAVLGGVALRRRSQAHDRHPSVSWQRTQGTVLSSTLQVRQQGASRVEVPLVLYAYQVDGQKYRGERIRCGGPSGGDAVTRYPAGARVDVFYDPQDPSVAVLER